MQALRFHFGKVNFPASLLRKQRLGRGLLDLRQLDADDLIYKVVQLFNDVVPF